MDSHAVLWWLADDPRLLGSARAALAEPSNQLFVSAATVWELSIKQALGKLAVAENLPDRLPEQGFDELPVTAAHAWAAGALPPHHRDPFDRLLVAQALLERLVLLSADPQLAAYGAATLW